MGTPPPADDPADDPADTTTDPADAIAGDPGEVSPTLPSTGARLIGFAAILVAGAAGGFIGYAVTDLQCTGDCTVSRGIGGLIGAVFAAVGVAVVVQLALRAMSEWRTIQATDGAAAIERERARRRAPPAASRPRPRVQ